MICEVEGCDKVLRSDNGGGHCQQHYRHSDRNAFRIAATHLDLDPDEVERYAKTHNGLCDICGGPPTAGKKRLSVEHCHKTGAFRGFVCQDCNTGIAKFNDDPELLVAAAMYLLRNPAAFRR